MITKQNTTIQTRRSYVKGEILITALNVKGETNRKEGSPIPFKIHSIAAEMRLCLKQNNKMHFLIEHNTEKITIYNE